MPPEIPALIAPATAIWVRVTAASDPLRPTIRHHLRRDLASGSGAVTDKRCPDGVCPERSPAARAVPAFQGSPRSLESRIQIWARSPQPSHAPENKVGSISLRTAVRTAVAAAARPGPTHTHPHTDTPHSRTKGPRWRASCPFDSRPCHCANGAPPTRHLHLTGAWGLFGPADTESRPRNRGDRTLPGGRSRALRSLPDKVMREARLARRRDSRTQPCPPSPAALSLNWPFFLLSLSLSRCLTIPGDLDFFRSFEQTSSISCRQAETACR